MPGDMVHDGPRLRAVGVLGSTPLAAAVTRHLLAELAPVTRVSIFGSLAPGPTELTGVAALPAASPADLAARSQVVLALFTETTEVEHHLTGPSGLEAGVHSPTTLVFGAAVPAGWLLELAGRLFISTAGLLQLVQAPLEPSTGSGQLGGLSIGVRATAAGYVSALPLLTRLGHCVHLGELGEDSTRTDGPRGT